MRQRYYTSLDNSNEKQMGDACAAAWDLTYIPKADNEGVYDAQFTDKSGKTVAISEFKVRNFKFGRFPDVVLSHQKVIRVVDAAGNDVAALFTIRDATGTLYWTDLRLAQLLSVKKGGRTLNTRDKWDVEDVVNIPNAHFHPITEKPV